MRKAVCKGKVIVTEKLGSSTYLYVETKNEPLVICSDGDTKLEVGDTTNVGFDPVKCHIFDQSNQSV